MQTKQVRDHQQLHSKNVVVSLPCHLRYVPFAEQCAIRRGIGHTKFTSTSKSKPQIKTIIVGGSSCCETDIYEMTITKENNSISYKSFKKDFGKINANLSKIGYQNTSYIHCHLKSWKDEKYIVIFDKLRGFNIYDIKRDQWVYQAKDNCRYVDLQSFGARSMYLTNNVLLVSDNCYLEFFLNSITIDENKNDNNNSGMNSSIDINKTKYDVKFKRILICKLKRKFNLHGLCCVDVTSQTSKVTEKENSKDKDKDTDTNENKSDGNEKDNLNFLMKFKLIAFGGDARKCFLSSFVIFNVTFCYKYKICPNSNRKLYKKQPEITVVEKEIESTDIKCSNDKDAHLLSISKWNSFGFGCIHNKQNEPIIVIVGGLTAYNSNVFSKSICLFNTVTYKMILKRNVLPVKCSHYPSVISYYDANRSLTSILVSQGNCIYPIDIHHVTTWVTIRLIWIAFYKNEQNSECLIKNVGKDIIIFILRFVTVKPKHCDNRILCI